MTPSKRRPRNRGARELHRWRKDLGYSMKVAAKLLGIWPQSYCEIETRGRRPRLDLAIAIAEKVGVEPRAWLQG